MAVFDPPFDMGGDLRLQNKEELLDRVEAWEQTDRGKRYLADREKIAKNAIEDLQKK